MPISGAYLFCNWRARSRSFPKTLTSSNFLFINGNGEKRACACVRVGGREEKTFSKKSKITIFGLSARPSSHRDRDRPALFWRQKGKKWGNPIRFLPPSLFSVLFPSLSLFSPSFMAKFVFQLSESLQSGKAAALVVAFGFSVSRLNELKRH